MPTVIQIQITTTTKKKSSRPVDDQLCCVTVLLIYWTVYGFEGTYPTERVSTLHADDGVTVQTFAQTTF